MLSTRAYVSAASGIALQDKVLLTVGGEVITATAARNLATAAIARGAVKAIPFVGAASLALDVWKAAGCKYEDAKIKCDAGSTPGPVPGSLWQPASYPGCKRETILAAMQCTMPSGQTLVGFAVVSQTATNATVSYKVQYSGGAVSGTNGYNLSKVSGTVTGCAGGVEPFLNGKCPTGTVDVCDATCIEAKFAQGIALQPASKLPAVAKEAIEAGQAIDSSPLSLTGPATSPVPKAVTTTGPSGTTTTTTTNNYQYEGDRVTYNQTSVTNVTNNAGDIISTTTTTDSAPEDERAECEKHPETVGCAEFDTPEGEIPKDSMSVDFQEENLFGAGACPADGFLAIGVIGGQTMKVVDWTTMCNFALPMRGLILALASVSAFFIVMPGGGNQS